MDNAADDIERLLSVFLEKILAGASPAEVREAIVSDHIHLQPELERQLRLAESIYKATKQKQADQTLRVDNDEAVTQFVPRERVSKRKLSALWKPHQTCQPKRRRCDLW